MELQALLNADYLDIVYDNRNKSYGGYVLRKQYQKRMLTSIAAIFAAITLLSAYSVLGRNEPTQNAGPELRYTEHQTTDIFIPPPKPKPQPVTPPAAQKTDMTKFTTPVVVKNDDVKTDPPKDISTKTAGPQNTTGTASIVSTTGIDTAGTAPIVATEAPKPALPITYAEVMPEFNGNLGQYLGRKLVYPVAARENGIEGTVMVQFVVSEDGTVSNAKVLRSVAGGCNEEALRVVSSMPKWKPGKQNGQPVKVYYTLPIRFVLQ